MIFFENYKSQIIGLALFTAGVCFILAIYFITKLFTTAADSLPF